MSSSLGIIGISVVFHLLTFIFTVYYKVVIRPYADAFIAYGLFDLLYEINRYPDRWSDVTFKRGIVYRLESVSFKVEHDLYRSIKFGDDITNAWMRETASRMAAALRELKRWILTPQSDTRDQLLNRLKNDFIYAALGEWDSLSRAEPVSTPKVWRTKLLSWLHTLLLAALPVSLFWVFQTTPIAFKGAQAEYVKVGVFVYAALTLLGTVDPSLTAKFASFREFWQIVTSMPRGKRD